MTHNAPLTPRPLSQSAHAQRRVLSSRSLREHGVSAAVAGERCRPGGPWHMPLPGVYLLHPGPPTTEDRLHACLLYAAQQPVPAQPLQAAQDAQPVRPVPAHQPPVQRARHARHARTGHGAAEVQGPGAAHASEDAREAQITGLAALTLHGFTCTPPLPALERIDVLVPHTRWLRSAGFAHIVPAQAPPEPEEITGLPVAPVPRALADAVRQSDDAVAIRRMLTEAVRARHCEARAVVRELSRGQLLTRPQVAGAIDALLAEGRAIAEEHLYDMVCFQSLPDPCWNVSLRLPGGPHLGFVDAYWPHEAVAVALDSRAPRHGREAEALWSEYARKRESLERLGITVVYLTPAKLRESPEQQAAIVRTALMAADTREPWPHVMVTPR